MKKMQQQQQRQKPRNSLEHNPHPLGVAPYGAQFIFREFLSQSVRGADRGR
jgi:hypothetical protein